MKRIILTKEQLNEVGNSVTINGKATINTANDLTGGDATEEVRNNKANFGPDTITAFGKKGTDDNEDTISMTVDQSNPSSLENVRTALSKNPNGNYTFNTISSMDENTIRLTKSQLDRFLLSQ